MSAEATQAVGLAGATATRSCAGDVTVIDQGPGDSLGLLVPARATPLLSDGSRSF